MEKDTKWIVNWASVVRPQCSCNGLTYCGIACLHICWVAAQKHQKIPLSWVTIETFVETSKSWSEQQPITTSLIDLKVDVTVEAPLEKQIQDNAHMNRVSLNGYFNDPRTCEIQAKFLTLQRCLLVAQQNQLQEVADAFITSLFQMMESQINEFKHHVHSEVPTIPHSQCPNTSTSYFTTPQLIDQTASQPPHINFHVTHN